MLYAEFPLGQDLSALNRCLTQNNIPHRFTEESGVQKLWLLHPEQADLVTKIIKGDVEEGSLGGEGSEEAGGQERGDGGVNELPSQIRELYRFDLKRNLFTLVFIALGFIGYLIVKLELQVPYYWVRFGPFEYLTSTHEYWRLLTPTFIHFSEMHVIFNCVWVWELGKRLEMFLGKFHYLTLFLLTALLSNLLQYGAGGSINFGGLSGVVYGYFGCLFILSRRWSTPILQLPRAFYGFMLVMLLLGFSGTLNLFVDGSIANWAHLGGLIGGLLFGILYQSIVKSR